MKRFFIVMIAMVMAITCSACGCGVASGYAEESDPGWDYETDADYWEEEDSVRKWFNCELQAIKIQKENLLGNFDGKVTEDFIYNLGSIEGRYVKFLEDIVSLPEDQFVELNESLDEVVEPCITIYNSDVYNGSEASYKEGVLIFNPGDYKIKGGVNIIEPENLKEEGQYKGFAIDDISKPAYLFFYSKKNGEQVIRIIPNT